FPRSAENESRETSSVFLHETHFPLIVVGAGHAGCEAALAAARLGVDTLLLTIDLNTIALMPCNPSIGGPGKGHLVREMGVLGAEMPRAIDETCLQLKWLNTSRGPAVRARRAQADKWVYRQRLSKAVFNTPHLTVRQGMAVELLCDKDRVQGLLTETGLRFSCEALVLATGTYLNGRIIIGPQSWSGGPQNQRAAIGLSESLARHGVPLRRLQTATPPRVHRDSLTYARMQELPGDVHAGGFLWENRLRQLPDQLSCHLTFTTAETIEAVRRHISQSPLVLGNITNEGPKHCPSIDRKVLKFPKIEKHQIFIEPEGRDNVECYLQGLTTSMPAQAQVELIRTVPGLERAEILRYGYAIEYDALAPGSMRKTMASRHLDGLFTAGQINGTSGYEEAAAQGLLAGINAAARLQGKPPLTLSRTQAYLGVLADDLSLWDHPEPYRMTPANAEFRLSLREDSAEFRLLDSARATGLCSPELICSIETWVNRINREWQRLSELRTSPTAELRARLTEQGVGGLKKQISALDLLSRPQISYQQLGLFLGPDFQPVLSSPDEISYLENETRYRGYADREQDRMQETRLLESLKLPLPLDHPNLKILSESARQYLTNPRYEDLEQLQRQHCLSRSDLAILLSVFAHPIHFTE
ncbi:MAG TPA: tRNA uridine-5-carboxymethylaminomethyl(34) synthesis enzyme MnmG, partial [Candidatus Ozemobacteraceae bacterium]|nr:tRNA uridine-5-carboxymethylaminomethyl(34) synthesis enzyme MnmG [Candidatus Ozemobacteraceae bacterium]